MVRSLRNWVASLKNHVNSPSYQATTEKIIANGSIENKSPYEMFANVKDEYWYWLNTEGYRKNPILHGILPGIPDEDTQLMFTGDKGDGTVLEGYFAYMLFKGLYTKHSGSIAQCENILDFGCGWGRIIRYFMKDVPPSKLWGCDPIQKMIDVSKEQNKWCNFTKIDTTPPGPYQDNMFDLIYSFSVFSHLSEEMSDRVLAELTRILKPGGMLIVTTRSRDFIQHCANLRKRKNLDTVNAGPKSSAAAFMDTKQSLADYDSGKYCFSQLVHEGEWAYWGDTAISKKYVLNHWTKTLNFVDYVDDQKYAIQNAIVMTKPV